MAKISKFKNIVKKTIGREKYGKILNTKGGSWVHDKLHKGKSSSRDFLLQKIPKKSEGVEIGVHEGNFSERILEIVLPKKLYLIDPWKLEQDEVYDESYYGKKKIVNQNIMDERFHNVRKRFEKEIKNNQIIIKRGYSEEILKDFHNDSLDWVYIDGNHLYEFVKKDLELCFMKIKNGGYICGDDYNDGGWWKGGVKKAVDEFVSSNNKIKVIEIKADQFILQKKANEKNYLSQSNL